MIHLVRARLSDNQNKHEGGAVCCWPESIHFMNLFFFLKDHKLHEVGKICAYPFR